MQLQQRRHDPQHNDIMLNDIPRNHITHNDIQRYCNEHYDKQSASMKFFDTQHKENADHKDIHQKLLITKTRKIMSLSAMTLCKMTV